MNFDEKFILHQRIIFNLLGITASIDYMIIIQMQILRFYRLFETEKAKIEYEYNRLQMGIIKVAETREKVAEISLELEKKKVLVAQLQRECEEFLEKIVEQKNSASERERVNHFFFL